MKKMNHIEYPKTLKGKTEAELRFIIKDCKEALEAYPQTDNADYYQDEICYCVNELNRRSKAKLTKKDVKEMVSFAMGEPEKLSLEKACFVVAQLSNNYTPEQVKEIVK